MQEAWGNVAVRTLPEVLGNDRTFAFDNGGTPDGQWLIGDNEPCNLVQNPGLPSYAVLYNVATRQMVTMQQLQSTHNQIITASADVDWVVWEEADDPPSFFDWTMFAYNRHTGQVERLGQAVKDASGQPVHGPFSGPVVDHDHVVWSEALAPATNAQDVSHDVAQVEDIATGTVTTLATGAIYATLSWPWAAWAQEGVNGTGWMQFKNLLTGQTARLNDQPTALALAGTSVAYVDDNTYLSLVSDLTQGTNNSQSLWTAPAGGYVDLVTMTSRLIGWNEDSAAIVYDRLLHRFVMLPVLYTQFSASTVSGHLLVWVDGVPASQQQQDGQVCPGSPGVTLNVVDTSTLPTTITGGG